MSTAPTGGRRTTALIVILAATFMQLLDISIVGVAAADIQQNLDAGAGGIALVLVGYQIGFACTLITAARLGDIHGRRRLFLLGMVSFTLASVLRGLTPSIGLLVTARVVQGIASGLMFPQVLSVIQVWAYRAPENSICAPSRTVLRAPSQPTTQDVRSTAPSSNSTSTPSRPSRIEATARP